MIQYVYVVLTAILVRNEYNNGATSRERKGEKMDEKKTQIINEEDLTKVNGGTGIDWDYMEYLQSQEAESNETTETIRTRDHICR